MNNFFDKSKWCRNSLVKLFKIITLVCTCIWYKCFVLLRCEYNVGAHTSVRLSSFSPLSQYRKPIWLLSWMPFNGVAWVRRDRELCRITWHYFVEIWYNCNETLTENFITLVNLIKICSECCTKLPTFCIIDYYKMLSFYNF